ncbi:MAG: cyclodeaminase/cyclohydrolase family protein [Candidatus Omnitrophica bacterium]|nr:cyclodeaminase/cyclohydrolase family protein [Candidatus Omnitrophota bacterium]MBU1046996.1 cyclodeaminase/cyclohydrolase family protein [Candidatus Omnitrophota bacterium]MBU1630773.1 cyclodeaminase/cyclohydrolase family protein [Candidatus Omnitrophota bacterium]MBU1889542.1 cyclodeaminase/cyclohydrolase family protein [Candidatus Omnitrophota bacterium]
MYINGPINKYLDDLASKNPAPGGGSAGALAGALAAGLMSMAVNYSIGKNPKNDKKLRTLLKQSESLRKNISKLIDEDIQAYKKVSVLFKSSKTNSDKIQKALKNAAKVPFEIAQIGVEIIELNEKIFPICNPRLLSDVVVSLSLAYSSVEIGILNVQENLAIIKDKKFNKLYRTKSVYLKKIARRIKNNLYQK